MKFLAILFVVVATVAVAHGEPGALTLGKLETVPQLVPIPTVITAARPAIAIASKPAIIASPILTGKSWGAQGGWGW